MPISKVINPSGASGTPGMAARSYGDSVQAACPDQLTLGDELHATMLRQAMSAWLRARGQDDSSVWKLTAPAVIATASSGRDPVVDLPESFAYEMFRRRALAFTPDCRLYETSWLCFVNWYAAPENSVWWLPQGTTWDSYMPDEQFARCQPRTFSPLPAQRPLTPITAPPTHSFDVSDLAPWQRVPGPSDAPLVEMPGAPESKSSWGWVVGAVVVIAATAAVVTVATQSAPKQRRAR